MPTQENAHHVRLGHLHHLWGTSHQGLQRGSPGASIHTFGKLTSNPNNQVGILGCMANVMVRPLVTHVPLKPCLHLQRLDLFLTLSDWPLAQLGHQSTSHSLSRTLIRFYFPPLLDTLDSPCLHFDPRPSSLTSVLHTRLSDSVSDSCIVADMVGTSA